MVLLVWQERLEEGTEPDRMTTDDDIIFLDRWCEDEVAKVSHPFQSIAAKRFVPSMEAHIDLVDVYRLEVPKLR